MRAERCGTCKYAQWHDKQDDTQVGECRRRPMPASGSWPRVVNDAYHWCGEYESPIPGSGNG